MMYQVVDKQTDSGDPPAPPLYLNPLSLSPQLFRAAMFCSVYSVSIQLPTGIKHYRSSASHSIYDTPDEWFFIGRALWKACSDRI